MNFSSWFHLALLLLLVRILHQSIEASVFLAWLSDCHSPFLTYSNHLIHCYRQTKAYRWHHSFDHHSLCFVWLMLSEMIEYPLKILYKRTDLCERFIPVTKFHRHSNLDSSNFQTRTPIRNYFQLMRLSLCTPVGRSFLVAVESLWLSQCLLWPANEFQFSYGLVEGGEQMRIPLNDSTNCVRIASNFAVISRIHQPRLLYAAYWIRWWPFHIVRIAWCKHVCSEMINFPLVFLTWTW